MIYYMLDKKRNLIPFDHKGSVTVVNELTHIWVGEDIDNLYTVKLGHIKEFLDKRFTINFSINDLGDKESSISLSKNIEGAFDYFFYDKEYTLISLKVNGVLLSYSTEGTDIFSIRKDIASFSLIITVHLSSGLTTSLEIKRASNLVTLGSLMLIPFSSKNLPLLFEFDYKY